MRSVLCALASAWFLFNAITLTVPAGAVQVTADGTPAALGDIGRTLFAGMAILAAAGIDWSPVARRLSELLDHVDVGAPR